MIPLVTLIGGMCFALILGRRQWRRKSTKVLLVAFVALVQTALLVYDMFTMKIPKL
jgi:hypothetical protein